MAVHEMSPAADAVDVDATISRTVRALLAVEGLTAADLAAPLGVDRTTAYRRVASGKWSAAEVAAVAVFLERPVGDLFTGRVGYVGDGRARHDSNVQPSDPEVVPATYQWMPGVRRGPLVAVRRAV